MGTEKKEEQKPCGLECEVFSRVCGFYRPVKNWNPGKQEEFRQRKTFKIPRKEEKNESK